MPQEEERNRYSVLIGRGNEIFERMESNISNLNNRCAALIGIILASISINLTLLLFLLQIGWQFSDADAFLLTIFVILALVALGILIKIFHPSRYKDLEMFEEKRFNELVNMSEKDLLSDFLYHLKEAYEYNSNKYNKKMQLFILALYLFIGSISAFILMIIKNIIMR